MLRSLVGSEMCIRDRYQRRVRGTTTAMDPIEDEEAILAAADENENEAANDEAEGDADEELEKLKKKWLEMEEEAEKLKSIADAEVAAAPGNDKAEADGRSLYVGQVDYHATPEELQAHFQSCGTINRVTIICDNWTGHSKGLSLIHI
eukprot:TRINITY_DN432_c0_g2_i3.p2 TRINITY_DN432_c0_g2~~TRINITY_DN432_c0_g2_i3.p2  ORF type:complete len:148 (+),score=74.62 TRINITY_DN432_c0_g2_i3:146-589(+)